jgi:sugar phosphate isomerase/epimerase
MLPLTPRRDFLKHAALLPLLAAGGYNALVPSAQAALTPVVRGGGPPRLKLSLNAYSFARQLNNQLRGRGQGMSLFDLIDFCAKNDFEGFDPTGYYMPGWYEKPRKLPTDAYLNELKRHAFEAGVGISGTGTQESLTTSNGADRKAAFILIKQWIEVAARLGAPVLRIFADTVGKDADWKVASGGAPRADVEDWIASGIADCAEVAKRFGVIIGIQNHGDFLRTADDLLSLVSKVNSPWCGAIVDTGYFRTPDPYVDMAKAAPYAVNWQVKTSSFPVREKSAEPDSAHAMDLIRLMKIIRGSGYRGYVPIEVLSKPNTPYDPFKEVPAFGAKVRAAIAATA